MLNVRIVNTGKGTDENASYTYYVSINGYKVIAKGKIDGHNRNDGWRKLLKMIAEDK